MKSKMLIATLLGYLAWQQGVLSQTDTTTTATNQSIGASTISPPMAAAAATNESPGVTAGNETAATTTANPPAATAASTSESPGATASNETAAASTANPPAATAASTSESPGATASNETASASAANPPVAPATSTSESPSAAASNETAGASATNPPVAPATSTNESPGATVSNATAGASAANLAESPAASTNASPNAATGSETTGASSSNRQAPVPASIPLIQFQDVPITTAIENLARQAGINYLLDPKIGYGQPDQSGQVKPEPTLSIRWENITAGQALMALLDNYGLQLVEDRRTHIARITTKDPTAPPPLSTHVIQLKYSSTSNMVESIQPSLTDKRSKVLPDARTSQLVVVATENEQEAVESLVNQLDKPTRQVLIETKLVEISSNPTTAKGVDWSGTLAAQNVSFGNGFMSGNTTVNTPGTPTTTTIPGKASYTIPGSTTVITTPGDSTHLPTTTTTTVDPTVVPATPDKTITTTPTSTGQSILNIIQGNGGMSLNTLSGLTPAIGFLNADGAHAVLSFLNAAYDAQITATPRIVTLDNQMATLEVTRTYPVLNMVGGTQNSAGSSSVTYSNVGTILQVTPRISANDYIWLRVTPVVSSFFGNVIVTVQGGSGNPSTTYPIPEFDNRKLDSQVMIPNGDTLVMGGLVQDHPTASYTKVPLLGDIPGLGWAFKSENKSTTKDNLIIFLTPTIIKNDDFQQASADSANFLQSKPPKMKSQINPNSIWDNAEPPGDWSNPGSTPGGSDKK